MKPSFKSKNSHDVAMDNYETITSGALQDLAPKKPRRSRNFAKLVFLFIFCASSIVQGMYSTYFVSILTTIERLYHIPSKIAGAILSASEVGQIIGSMVVSYYGSKASKPKWISWCMVLTSIAAMLATLPNVVFTNQQPYNQDSLSHTSTSFNDSSPFLGNSSVCTLESTMKISYPNNHGTTKKSVESLRHPQSYIILAIFSSSLLLIGFGSTAIMTLGIPFIDEIVSKEDSPLYLGVTIGLRIFGPALGFMLGSYCIQLEIDNVLINVLTAKIMHLFGNENNLKGALNNNSSQLQTKFLASRMVNASLMGQGHDRIGAWWFGLYLISLPLLCLAWPMYVFSKSQLEKYPKNYRQESTVAIATDEESINDIDQSITSSSKYSEYVRVGTSIKKSSIKEQERELDNPLLESYNDCKDPTFKTSKYSTNLILNSPIWNQCEKQRKVCTEHMNDVSYDAGPKNIEICSESLIMSSSSSISIPKLLSPHSMTELIWKLLNNRLFLLRILSGILHILPIAGFYTFLPKYLIEQYGIDAGKASAISGLAGIMVIGFGAFIGGTVIRVFRIDSKKVSIWIASSALLYAIGMLILMQLGCSQNKTVGFGLPYQNQTCERNCHCLEHVFKPVCKDGMTYLSPCLAGCTSFTFENNTIEYNDCSCEAQQETSVLSDSSIAYAGNCNHDCTNLKWYIIVFSLFTMIHASSEVGAMIFNLRSVEPSERTLAFGIISFSLSLLGNIPCSIIYGTVIDLTCIKWDSVRYDNGKVIESGACKAYDNEKFRYYLHGITSIFMICAFIVDCVVSRRCERVKFYTDNNQENDTS